jgi:type II secretory pathway pseudopilin PulG
MKSVKCPECGFVGWAEAERCKKCGVLRLADPSGEAYQESQNYGNYEPVYRVNSGRDLKQGLAVASLVLGILGFVSFGILGVGAITGSILAIVAMRKAKQQPHVYGGSGLATAGLITNLLSVVLIVPIGIVAAIAIPNLLAARQAANEGASIAALRRIHTAEATYQATRGNGEYGTLAELADSSEAEPLINPALLTAHYGYNFVVETASSNGESPAKFHAVAVPVEYGTTGRRSFYVDETGVIRGENLRGEQATELSPPLDQDDYSPRPQSQPQRRYASENGY